MAKISMKGKGDIQEITETLAKEIRASGFSCELVESSKRSINDNLVIFLVFEKYYMRASNRASLSVMLTQNEDVIYIDSISSGGGQGAILKFSWGAESSFLNIVPEILIKKGFVILDD